MSNRSQTLTLMTLTVTKTENPDMRKWTTWTASKFDTGDCVIYAATERLYIVDKVLITKRLDKEASVMYRLVGLHDEAFSFWAAESEIE